MYFIHLRVCSWTFLPLWNTKPLIKSALWNRHFGCASSLRSHNTKPTDPDQFFFVFFYGGKMTQTAFRSAKVWISEIFKHQLQSGRSQRTGPGGSHCSDVCLHAESGRSGGVRPGGCRSWPVHRGRLWSLSFGLRHQRTAPTHSAGYYPNKKKIKKKMDKNPKKRILETNVKVPKEQPDDSCHTFISGADRCLPGQRSWHHHHCYGDGREQRPSDQEVPERPPVSGLLPRVLHVPVRHHPEDGLAKLTWGGKHLQLQRNKWRFKEKQQQKTFDLFSCQKLVKIVRTGCVSLINQDMWSMIHAYSVAEHNVSLLYLF